MPRDPTPTTQEKETSTARNAFTASLHTLGKTHTAPLVDRAKTLHENERALRNQEDRLARTTAELRRENEAWSRVADEAREGLKELGDLQNWAEVVERELLVLEETVRSVEMGREGDWEGDWEGERERERERVAGGGFGGDGEREREEVGNGMDMMKKDDDMGKGNGNGKGEEKRGWFGWW